MRFAVVEGGDIAAHVVNVIVADESQKEALEEALSAELVDAAPLGLEVGDFFNGTAWTRNVGGEQRGLPMEPSDVDALLAILEGGGEDGAD
ncbi:hypothetical protein FACS1894196_4830 [Clostridia bacterium]|nr:hypothetical protein FACS1894196_4830 [Clostridia bacterium]